MQDPDLKAMLELCRPGHADWHEPELAPLAEELIRRPDLQEQWQRQQRLDTAIAATLHEVTVPADLANRLLAALAAQQAVASTATAEAAATPATDCVTVAPVAAPVVTRRSRRAVLAWLATAAAAVVVPSTVGYWLWSQPNDRQLTVDWAVLEAQRIYDQPADSDWKPTATAPRHLPVSFHLNARYLTGWRWQTYLGRQTVAYHLVGAEGKPDGMLLVVPLSDTPAVPTAPGKLIFTRGMWSTAWRQNDRLYVLVIKGKPGEVQSVQHFLRPVQLT